MSYSRLQLPYVSTPSLPHPGRDLSRYLRAFRTTAICIAAFLGWLLASILLMFGF